MKTFLVPSTFDTDTIKALKLANDMFSSPSDRIILCSISELSNSISDLLLLSSSTPVDLGKRQVILDYWQQFKKETKSKGTLTTHHQYGLSRPRFNAILERFHVSMSIIPESFQQSKLHVHQFALKLLHQSNCPMMVLPEKLPVKGIQRALYLDEAPRAQMIEGYPFHVIHKSMVGDAEYPSVESMVEALNIDLIVRGKRDIESSNAAESEISAFGLPVLAV